MGCLYLTLFSLVLSLEHMNCVTFQIYSWLANTYLVDKIRAAHSSDLANVVHETQVSLSGAVHLTHSDVSKAALELLPNIRPQPIPDAHPHLVNSVQLALDGRRTMWMCRASLSQSVLRHSQTALTNLGTPAQVKVNLDLCCPLIILCKSATHNHN